MDLSQLPGLGPKSQDMLKLVGIKTVEQFSQCEPFELFRSLKQVIPNVSLNMLYAIIGAQESLRLNKKVHWQEVKDTRRTEILMRLDDMGIAPK